MTLTSSDAALRILFITLEFEAGAFSGNGIYAQSQVSALASAGHRVHVLSGRPAHDDEDLVYKHDGGVGPDAGASIENSKPYTVTAP
jgi:hypothetical protein